MAERDIDIDGITIRYRDEGPGRRRCSYTPHTGVPGATLAIVEGAGHPPNPERRDEFKHALAGLLPSTRPAERQRPDSPRVTR